MNKFLLFVMILVLSLGSNAFEGEIVPGENGTLQIEEGSTFDATIRIWPVDSQDNILKSINDGKINEYLYLVQKKETRISENNSDVAELLGLFALVKAFKPNEKIQIKINNHTIQLDVRRITTIATAPPSKEFEFVQQPEGDFEMQTNFSSILIMLSFLVLCALTLIIYRKTKNRNDLRRKRIEFENQIQKANTRIEIESVNKSLEKYDIYLNLKNIKEFKEYIELIQYKASWSDDEMEKVLKLKGDLIND